MEPTLDAAGLGPAAATTLGPAPALAPQVGLRHALRAFRTRRFLVFWTGALVSNTGSWVQNLTIPYVLYEQTGSATWVGIATFSQFVPTMLLGPLAGSIADRHDRRRVLMVTQALMALAALAMWAAWVAGERRPITLVALVALSGVFAGLNIPSWQSFVNDLVPRRDLLSAITLNSLQFNAARALGPALAGLLLATCGPGWAFFVNVASFGSVLLALKVVRTEQVPQPRSHDGFVRQFVQAVGYVRRQPGILLAIQVAVLVGALGNPVFQFTVIFADDVFHVGPLGLSMMNVALGVGAVVIAPMVSGWDSVVSRANLTRWSLLAYGSGLVAFALAPGYAVGIVALVVVGGAFLVAISATNTTVQVIVADGMRGRVIAARVMAFTGAYPVGALAQAALSDVIGPRLTVAGAGAGLLVAAVVLATRPALLARLDDPHDEA